MKQSLLEDIFKALERRLSPPFKLDDLARDIGFSKYHLCRAFHAATGEGLVTYLRRLSLAKSAENLARGERIIEVALAHGYQSQEAYHRAFVKMFGLTPVEYQRGEAHHSLLLKRPWRSDFMPGSQLETYRKSLPAFSLWGMGGEYSYTRFDEIFELWRRFHERIAPTSETFGVTFGLPSSPEHFRYFAASTQQDQALPLKSLAIPAQQYQVFIHQGTADTLMQSFNYIWGVWLPESGLKASGVDFERYPPDYRPEDPDGKIEIYIPISQQRCK